MNNRILNILTMLCLTSIHLFAPEEEFSASLRTRSPKSPSRPTRQELSAKINQNTVQRAIEGKNVAVLQQRSDTPFFKKGTNLETDGDGRIFGQPGLLWKNVRMYDNTNCGYHALKNIRFMLSALQNPRVNVPEELAKPNSLLNQQLLQFDNFVDDLAVWTSQVHQERKDKIYKALKSKEEDNPTALKSNRSRLSPSLKSYVNSNDGSINVDDLGGEEVESLLKNESSAIKNNVVVMEYTPGIPEIGMDENIQTSPAMQARITKFKASQKDILGIVWNEEEFHHWVGYVAHKENGKVTIYAMNSISAKEPQNIAKLFEMLKP